MSRQPETKVFLKYARKRECWICSFCDTENESDQCHLCGSVRLPGSVVKPSWDNMLNTYDNVVANVSDDMEEIKYDYSENKGVGNVVGRVISWLMIFLIIISIIVIVSFICS